MIKFAFSPNRAPMRQNNMFGDGESQPCASRLPGPSFVHTVEPFKETGKMSGSDARPQVPDVKLNALRCCTSPKENLLPGRGILQRIFNQVRKNLVNGLAIGTYQSLRGRSLGI